MTATATNQSATESVDTAPAVPKVDFDTAPDRYRHWRLDVDGEVATVTLTGPVGRAGVLGLGHPVRLPTGNPLSGRARVPRSAECRRW